MVCLVALVGLGGCRHKTQIATLPPVQTPVGLENTPPPPTDKAPLIETQPVKLPPVPVAAAATKPKKEKKKPTKVVTTTPVPATPAESAPVQVAGAAAPVSAEATAIGSLTAGGEASPQKRQEAGDLIASIEKRLNALPAQKAEEEKGQISKVKNFLRDSQAALQSGDAEGAMTLATKAKLLLDDLEK
jgi:ribosomal protein S20